MSNNFNNMKWLFAENLYTESPQHSGMKDFSKHLLDSIVREPIQNSLDNVLDKSKPVIIKFSLSSIEKEQFPDSDGFKLHFKKTLDDWNADYKSLVDELRKSISDNNDEYLTLEISDYNTTGMSLSSRDGNKIKSNYFAFTRGNNTVKSSNTSGGSEGQGKSVLYASSNFRTIFIQSKSKEGVLIEGMTKLASHSIDGIRYGSTGHIFQDIKEPIYNQEYSSKLPFEKRIDLGTSIYIVCLKEELNLNNEEIKKDFIKAVLRNFWLSILNNKIIVTILNITISKDNIEQMISEYLPDYDETRHFKSKPHLNLVLPYYETYINSTPIEKELTRLGKCKFYLKQNDNYPGRISFHREQNMLIFKDKGPLRQGFSGVFICESSKGNEKLRKLEGKEHKEWEATYYTENKQEGKEIIKELNNFILDCWNSYEQLGVESINLKAEELFSSVEVNDNVMQNFVKGTLHKEKPTKPEKKKLEKTEYQKTGVHIKGIRTLLKDNKWIYTLKLSSKRSSKFVIELQPATDSTKKSNVDNLEVSIYGKNSYFEAFKGDKNKFIFNAESEKEVNFNFTLVDINERVGLIVNVKEYEN